MVQKKKEINVRIGSNIQRLREEKHFTQEVLSEIIGVTPNHLSAIERGVSGVSLELLEKLCLSLRVTSDQILFGHKASEVDTPDFTAMIHETMRTQQHILKYVEELTKSIHTISEKDHTEKPNEDAESSPKV